MRTKCSGSNISLRGHLNTCGITLHGRYRTASKYGASVDKEFLDFKLYIITHFLNPIMEKNYDLIKNNYFNFEYIISKLETFKNHENDEEIEFLIKVMNILQYSTNVRISFDEAKKKLYGADNENRLLVETSRIVLQSQYEIYNILFGRPHNKNAQHSKYNMEIILDIKYILDRNPGILFEDVKAALANKYGHMYLAV